MFVASCPLRVSLFGGSTDNPSFIQKYGYGSVISFASTLKTYISLHQDKLGYNVDGGKFIINYSKREEINNINEIVNEELINYYFTPGKIFNLIYFAKENKIDLKLLSIQKFLNLIIDNLHYKKESKISYIIFDFVEIFLSKFINKKYHDLHSYFLKRIEDIKKFNLDKESFFLELKSKLLNE